MDHTAPPAADGGHGSLRRILIVSALVMTVVVGLAWVIDRDGDTTSESAEPSPPSATPSSRLAPAPSTSSPVTSTIADAPACPPENWPLRARLAQLVMVGADPVDADAARQVVEEHGVGGIFIGGNSTGLLTGGTLAGLRGPYGVVPFVAIDDEGGRVQRIDDLVGDLSSARVLATTRTPEEVAELARARGEQLRELGVNVNFAPVVDVTDQADGEVIGDRSFGNDPDTVITYAGAFAAGLDQAGVLPVYKHFPGHGHADADSHHGTAITPHLDQLEPDLAPYRSLLGSEPLTAAVMIGHMVVPGLTDDEPASISPAAITELLRTELGFAGLVFTDDLSGMRAITDVLSPAEAAVRALAAGADVALLVRPPDVVDLLDHLEAAVELGTLGSDTVDQALTRVLAAKGHAC